MVRIVHAADLHLDATYSFLSGQKLDRRREDFLDSLTAILGLCEEERADVLLLAGDVFDKVNPTNNARFHALNSLRDFTRKTETKVFVVSGNHDEPKMPDSRSPLDLLGVLDRVFVVSGSRWKQFRHKDEGFDVGFYLKGYDGVHPGNNPLGNMPVGGSDVNIALLHGSLGAATSCYSNYKDYAPFSEKDVCGKNMSYIGLGHLHEEQKYVTEEGIFAYPGCPQRYSFKETSGDKGVYVLDVEKDFGEECVRFHGLPCRELVVREIELDTSMSDIGEVILEKVPDEGADKLLNIVLRGQVLFDAYKNLRMSSVVSYLDDFWFSIKVDKEFTVYDPDSEFEFRDLRAIGPLDEFKRKMGENISLAKNEGNEVLEERYRWMLEHGLGVLHQLEERG